MCFVLLLINFYSQLQYCVRWQHTQGDHCLQSYLQDRTQFVKLGQHRSYETTLEVGVPQGSVLGLLLFAVYCSPVADVIASHGVRCHQYADDTQLHLAMCVDNTAAGLSILAACTTDVKQWYMQNGLKLNPDKSEALFMGTATQLRSVSSLTSVSVANVDLKHCNCRVILSSS